MFFRKKTKKEIKDTTPTRIYFESTDTMYKRAENIWYSMGFVNDRGSNIPKIAALLEMYKAWDEDKDPPDRPDIYLSENDVKE